MERSRVVRLLCVVIGLCLLICAIPFTSANTVQPRYVKIDTLSANLKSISLAGRATCVGYVSLWDSSCTVTLYVELQQSSDGVNWDPVKTWSQSGSGTVGIDEYWYVDSGYQYQVVSSALVYSSTGAYIEGDAVTSGIISY